MICRHTNCNKADVTCFKAMLIIFSVILKETKEKLNFCTISQCQNTFMYEVDMSIASPRCWQKIWTDTRHLNRRLNVLSTLCDTWHYRINNKSLVRRIISFHIIYFNSVDPHRIKNPYGYGNSQIYSRNLEVKSI